MYTFGPVPSRRLGRSLGINNIPPKSCSYSCVYCQVGRTTDMRARRKSFYPVEDICRDVEHRLRQAKATGEHVDFLTFVPDGEPTLDISLGTEIERLRPLGTRIAVITNGSLLCLDGVQDELAKADWVSLKVDAVWEEVWRKTNRPHPTLHLASILEEMVRFVATFRGQLVTETMLVKDVNDSSEHVQSIADFLARLKPMTAYLAIPTRPPAEAWVRPPDDEALNRCYHLLSRRIEAVEYLIGYEGDAFASTGDVREDLLRITAVHPMREEAVRLFLARAGAEWSLVQELTEQGQLARTEFEGQSFYVRRFRTNRHALS